MGSSEDSDRDQELLGLASEMIGKHICKGTSLSYLSKLKVMGSWLGHFSDRSSSVGDDGMPALPLNDDETLKFFAALVEVRTEHHPVFGKPSEGLQKNNGHLAASTVAGYKSALTWLHRTKKQEMNTQLNSALNLFMTGYRKQVAGLKQSGDMCAFEGKQALSFSGYRMLADRLMKLEPQSSTVGNRRAPQGADHPTAVTWMMGLFSWTFMVLQWNLIVRSVTCAGIMLAHFSWKDDHLTITSPKHKGDQSGINVFPKSVFANPLEPAICPILAIAVLIFCRPHRPQGVSPQLFEGTDQEDRFSKVLSTVLSTLPGSLTATLGAQTNMIGTHSLRKGPPTYALSMPGGPSPVSIFLRAGWSLGNTKDR
jgi:hypothetical protein